MYTWNEMVSLGVPQVAYIEWRSVLSALPPIWKNINAENLNKQEIENFFISHLSTINSKSVYTTFTEELTIPSSSEDKLRNICEDDTIDFEQYYTIPYKCTIESKARSFQYKINHNIYFTNEKLYRFRMVPSPSCALCGNIETLKHIK